MTLPTTGWQVLWHWAFVLPWLCWMMMAAPVLHPLPQRSYALHLLGGREKLKRTIAERFASLFNHISAAGLWTSIVTLVSEWDFEFPESSLFLCSRAGWEHTAQFRVAVSPLECQHPRLPLSSGKSLSPGSSQVFLTSNDTSWKIIGWIP